MMRRIPSGILPPIQEVPPGVMPPGGSARALFVPYPGAPGVSGLGQTLTPEMVTGLLTAGGAGAGAVLLTGALLPRVESLRGRPGLQGGLALAIGAAAGVLLWRPGRPGTHAPAEALTGAMFGYGLFLIAKSMMDREEEEEPGPEVEIEEETIDEEAPIEVREPRANLPEGAIPEGASEGASVLIGLSQHALRGLSGRRSNGTTIVVG